jgi:hypothetical protein
MTDAAWERECAARKARARREQEQQHRRMSSKERWLLIDKRHPKGQK